MTNKLTTIGRQTADPVQNTVNGVDCVNFTVASDTRFKDDEGNPVTNFYRATAWRGLAGTCMTYLHKGDKVFISGDLLFRTYVDTKGQERSTMNVTIQDIEFLSDRRNADNTGSTKTDRPQPQKQSAPTTSAGEDDLPF